MTNVIYEVKETYEEAVKHTPEDLAPLIVKLVHVPDLPPVYVEIGLKENHYPYAVVCMTTRFTDPLYDGKLGWYSLPDDVKQVIGQLLYDNDLKEEWVFLSQSYE